MAFWIIIVPGHTDLHPKEEMDRQIDDLLREKKLASSQVQILRQTVIVDPHRNVIEEQAVIISGDHVEGPVEVYEPGYH